MREGGLLRSEVISNILHDYLESSGIDEIEHGVVST